MTTTYKIRSKLTKSELNELNRLRSNFDNLYPFTSKLNSLINNISFNKTPMEKLCKTIIEYYNKIEELSMQLMKSISIYQNLVIFLFDIYHSLF